MWRLAVLIWFMHAGVVSAQVVTVRSGQHDGYTRLVMTLPEPGAWDFGRTGDGYAFRTRTPGMRYDISTVFDRIPRDRLVALWTDPETGVLRLGLGCACHAIATPFRPGVVVIDIREGAAPSNSPYEAALSGSGQILPPIAPVRLTRPKARPAELVVPAAGMPGKPPDLPLQERFAKPTRLPLFVQKEPDPRADALRQTLLRDLARGIAAGAVTPADRLPEQPSAKASPSPPPQTEVIVDLADAAQLQIRPGGESARLDTGATGARCIPDAKLDVASWAGEGAVAEQLSQSRAGLLGEFDRPDRERLLASARLHLHFGFGAEARSLLQLAAPDDPERNLLESLSTLVDGPAKVSAFRGMRQCDTAAALWSLLSDEQQNTSVAVNKESVLRAFSALPLGLRRHLGPLLSERFLTARDATSARAIRDAIDRAPGPHGEGLAMIEADLALSEGRINAADQKLDGVVKDDGLAAARALATMINNRIDRGEVPDPAQLLALEAMMRERQGLDEEQILLAALVRGLTVTGDADRAFRTLASAKPGIFPELWNRLSDRATDMEFVMLALDPPGPAINDLPSETRLSVAERLLVVGFPDAAEPWIDGLSTPDTDVLRARIALALRDGRSVLRHLAGQSSPDAEALRGAALELLADYEAASLARLAAGQVDEAGRLRFLQRDWDLVSTRDDAALGVLLAARVVSDAATDPSEGQEQTLARARNQLEESANIRTAVEEMLAARKVPDG